MSVIIAPGVILSPSNPDNLNGNSPLVGWHNLVQASGVVASSEADGYPALTVANPQTFSRWRATSAADQTLTITIPIEEAVDYLAIAKHNLWDAQSRISVEAGVLGVFTQIAPDIMVGDNKPIIFVFTQQNMDTIRINFKLNVLAPELSVVYVGRILRLQRRIYVGHVPLHMGTKTDVITGRSEGGDYLGAIVTSQMTQSEITLANLTPLWVRQQLRPWLIKANQKEPFFFSWRPLSYPTETGYCWFLNDAMPKNSKGNGMMQFAAAIEGISS